MDMRRLLFPLTAAWRLALAMREYRMRRGLEPVRRLGFPVISIGNLSTGGAGKTPFAIALAKALSARGFDVDVLSRGYGRRTTAPERVDPNGSPEEFGDEPVLIAREAGVPVYVASERYDAGLLAEDSAAKNHSGAQSSPRDMNRPRIHLLDDAFQHRQLHRDVDILLLNREDWRGRLLPAGNLREPVGAIKRADVIAIPENEGEMQEELRAWGWEGPIWRLRRGMEVPRVDGPVVAFCGIARPEQFFAGLEAAGLRIAARIAFRDHYRYSARDLERLMRLATDVGANSLITTQKDEIRLETTGGSWRSGTLATKNAGKTGHGNFQFFTAGLRTEFHDEEAALGWVIRQLGDTAVRLSV